MGSVLTFLGVCLNGMYARLGSWPWWVSLALLSLLLTVFLTCVFLLAHTRSLSIQVPAALLAAVAATLIVLTASMLLFHWIADLAGSLRFELPGITFGPGGRV